MLTSAFCGSGVSRHQCRQCRLFEETSPPIFGNRDCKQLTVCLMFDGKVRPRCLTVSLGQSPTSLATVTWTRLVRETQLSTATTATTASGDSRVEFGELLRTPRAIPRLFTCRPTASQSSKEASPNVNSFPPANGGGSHCSRQARSKRYDDERPPELNWPVSFPEANKNVDLH
jgi:hypothetical protein